MTKQKKEIGEVPIKVIVPRALYQLGVEKWGLKYMRKWYIKDRKPKISTTKTQDKQIEKKVKCDRCCDTGYSYIGNWGIEKCSCKNKKSK